MKGRALRRALATADVTRVNANVPLLTDTTELITPALAQEMLHRNHHNRPINWRKVEEYSDAMSRGAWKLHSQGIVLDTDNNILTGQKRLWAVVYSGTSVYMRVSRGNPKDIARLLDRGTPQTARDLASRDTERKHSPIEASIARALCVLNNNRKPSVDQLADTIANYSQAIQAVMMATSGTRKTRAVLMLMAAIVATCDDLALATRIAGHISAMSDELHISLAPHTPDECWGRGAAFGLALESARRIVLKEQK